MEHDGFSLDDKRLRVPESDIPDLLSCWQHRHDPKFQKQRAARLADLQKQIAPLEREINQLDRQFWVTKDQVAAQGYDLSASRYRQIEQDEVFYEQPVVTLERLRELERASGTEVATLAGMLAEAPTKT